MDPAAEPLLRIRQGAEASIATMSSSAHFFAMLEVENQERRFADLLRRARDPHGRHRAAREGGHRRRLDP